MQPVFNVLFIWLFICFSKTVNSATLWPGLFAQSVLRTPVFWPTPYHSSTDDLATNLQQSESSHLLGSAEHLISSDEPIPSGLFIPVDQLHRELFNSPNTVLRKHGSNHYPSYHQFALNHFHHNHPNKKLISSSPKHHHSHHHKPSSFSAASAKSFKSLNKNFANKKKNYKEDFNDKFSYLDDFYARGLFNKLNNGAHQLLPEYDYTNQELDLGKNWQKFKTTDQDQTNSLINTTEEHVDQDEDDLFTIKNNSNEQPIKQQNNNRLNHQNKFYSSNGRIDLRKANKRKQHLKEMKDMKDIKEYRDTKTVKDIREFKEINDSKDLRETKNVKEHDSKDFKQANENRYIENYDSRNIINNNKEPIDKFTENRNIERYNLEHFFNNEKLNQDNRDDGRILISSNNRKENSAFKTFKSPNGELSVISETIYPNHQIKNDRRSPSRLVLVQNYDRSQQFESSQSDKKLNNESITIQKNQNIQNNDTDDQNADKEQNPTKTEPNMTKLDILNEDQINQLFGTTYNSQRVIPTPQISYMQSMFTESNTIPTNDQTGTTKNSNTYQTSQSERSQLNNNNHFSTLAISGIIIASLIAALLFTGSSLFLMYKVSQIKKRRLMRFQETANRNQFEAVFPVQTSCKATRTVQNLESPTPSLTNNIISNNNFIRQQKSLFSNLNSRCNASKTMLSITEQDPNFTIKNKSVTKTATINKKAGKHLNLNLTNDECYVTQLKTSTDQKNSALSRLISKMTNQDETNNEIDQNAPSTQQHIQRVSFF